MRSRATFVPGFLLFIFYSSISDVQPFRLYRSYQEEQRGIMGDDPSVRVRINWSRSINPKLPKLDYVPPIPQPPYVVERPERSETRIGTGKRKCFHGFCEEVDNYPEDLIKNILKQSNLDEYFTEAEVTVQLNNRGGFDDEEDVNDTLCPVASKTVYPKSARNTKQEEKLLINVDGYKQGVVSETCVENVKACKFSDSFPVGYVSACKQKYVTRRLATLGAFNKTLSWDTFEIPSCCVCIIKRSRKMY